MATVVIAVIEERGCQDVWKRAERDVLELARSITVVDNRKRPGEGLVICPFDDRAIVEDVLEGIDDQWADGLEIIDPGPEAVRRLLQ